MAIVFQCPRCNAEIKVPDSAANQKGLCPSCQAKLRIPPLPVPDVPAPPPAAYPAAHAPAAPPPAASYPAAPPPSVTAIEFQCPRCSATIRVPPDAAGKKGMCPQCQGKLRVPEIPPTAVDPAAYASPPAGYPGTGYPASGAAAGGYPPAGYAQPPGSPPAAPPPAATAPEPSIARKLRRRSKMKLGVLLIPLICVGALAGVLIWLFAKSAPKLEGTLKGEHLVEGEMPPAGIDKAFIPLAGKKLRELEEFLELEPFRMNSSLMEVEISGSTKGLIVTARPGKDTELFRCDPRANKFLTKHVVDHLEEYEKVRRKDLQDAVPKLIKLIEDLRKNRKGGQTDLIEFRNSVGLASLVGGFGYQVEAVYNGEVYRCVSEDTDGKLYFLLPKSARHFELKGREFKQGAKFPGRYKVDVTEVIKPQVVEPKKEKSLLD